MSHEAIPPSHSPEPVETDLIERANAADIMPLAEIMARLRDPVRGCPWDIEQDFATFLGPGTRTASWATLESPSDCAVPDRFTFRFDRRLTVGETPAGAVASIEGLDAVRDARAAGLKVEVRVPVYEQPTWRGYVPGNEQSGGKIVGSTFFIELSFLKGREKLRGHGPVHALISY
jgi:acetylornithine deacetylase/succinyl-diaminopimelate desuccinylase-like protein